MNNPFRNLVKKPARHEKGGIVVADSGNVKEVAKIMIGFEALLRETQSYMSKACGNKLFDSDLKDAMLQLIKQYMKDHNYYVPHMNLAEAADRLYVEMAEYSFLTPLLARKEIEITIADIRTGNYEAAITRFEGRIGSTNLSEVCRGFIQMIRGDDTSVYWETLAIRFSELQKQYLRNIALKIPPKVHRLSFFLMMSMMLLYIVVLGWELLSNMGVLFG